MWRGLAQHHDIQLPTTRKPRRGPRSSVAGGGAAAPATVLTEEAVAPVVGRRATRLSSNLKRAFFVGAVSKARNHKVLCDKAVWKLWMKLHKSDCASDIKKIVGQVYNSIPSPSPSIALPLLIPPRIFLFFIKILMCAHTLLMTSYNMQGERV